MRVWYLPFLFLFSCGSIQKMGLRSTSPVFQKAGDLTIRERSWTFFKESSASSIKLTELLYLQDTGNDVLHQSLVKGYAGYGFAVSETLAFEDEISGVNDSAHAREAIDMYTRSLDYGVSYLKKKNIHPKDLLTLREDKLFEKFDEELSEGDFVTLLFTGQSWGSLINLQKDNMLLVSHVPRIKLIFDWVCKKNPTIENGVCDIFFAQYEASRPRMLGGNPEKAKELYLAAMKKYPKNLLLRVGYIQYLILPAMESDRYEKEASLLKKEFSRWEDLNRDDLEDRSPYKDVQDFNLFNAIAKKRFEIIEKYKTKIF